ncbi:hypothetical protein HPP92_023756 [Vanilla planifolia]|uniref:RING-CH-type domain-containing protein n=1 Tax=Vanilla planifolia TaxID=51239 RepID=A0A835PNH4_VANPL|nr:hypothetical protein HPP92_024098 [Vanilla planifolia]KAG0455968.1 hypothetical protein HPP92_023756 [Vanilla planifolia]
MGDHLALLVDRLLTESTLAATIESRRKAETGHRLVCSTASSIEFNKKVDPLNTFSAEKVAECRICLEEDDDAHMEVPCSCRGSLKYAHRKCVQQWCNEKGDTTCEICLQQFKPGYTVSSQVFHCGEIPMNFRGRWEVYRREVHNSEIITMVPSDRNFDSDYEYYSLSSSRSAIYCRSIAIISIVLLTLRHILPVVTSESGDVDQDLFTMFMMLAFGTIGIILPVIVLIRMLNAFRRHRQNQGAHGTPSSEEAESPAHVIHIQ